MRWNLLQDKENRPVVRVRADWRSSTSFYVVERPDAAQMAFHIACAFDDDVTDSVLAGWVDSRRNDDFQTFFTLVERGALEGLEDRIRTIMNNLNI